MLDPSDADHSQVCFRWRILAAELNVRTQIVKQRNQPNNQRLLRVLRKEAAFFDAGRYGRPFRSRWRPTLLLRDSPACINYRDTGRQNPCRECPLFSMVPPGRQNELIPCHHIPLNVKGETVADLYAQGSQEFLDQLYRNWLEQKIKDLATL
jgi:hypothetical protein